MAPAKTDKRLCARRSLPAVICCALSCAWLPGCGQTGALVRPGELALPGGSATNEAPANDTESEEEESEQ